MKIAAAGIVLIGALISYLSKPLLRRLRNGETEEKDVLKIKFTGLAVAMIGMLLLFLSEGR